MCVCGRVGGRGGGVCVCIFVGECVCLIVCVRASVRARGRREGGRESSPCPPSVVTLRGIAMVDKQSF